MQGSTIGLLIAFAYGISSASMAFANKAVLSSYDYDYPIFLVASQMIFTIVVLESLRIVKIVSLPNFTFERGKGFFLPSLFYAINSVLGLTALSDMNIPMFGMLKRCGPLVTLVFGTIILKKGWPNPSVIASVITITAGCLVASFGDLAFDLHAYLYGFASVLSQALYLVLVQKSSQTLSAVETLHLNSFNTFPLLIFVCLITGEFKQAIQNFHFLNIPFIIVLTVVISMGCLLNYLLFLCTTYNSALTTSITGTVKSILQIIIGIFTFGGISINVYTMGGMMINLTGGIWYTVAKYRESQAKALLKNKSQATLSNAENGDVVMKIHPFSNGVVHSEHDNEHSRKRTSSECMTEEGSSHTIPNGSVQ